MKNCLNLLFASLLALSPVATASDNPTGSISADSELVRAGAYPRLDWNITYPVTVLEWIDITERGEIIPKTDLTMQVRNLAADVQRRTEYWNGWRWTVEYTYLRVTAYGRVNNRSWRLLFNNTQPYVNPSAIAWEEELEEGDQVKFAARYSGGGYYYSGQSSPNVLVLKDGDLPPTYATWDTQSTLGSHIDPYLDANGLVDIGPRDVIVAFELTHDMSPGNDGGGDMQDMIFLLTFQVQEED